MRCVSELPVVWALGSVSERRLEPLRESEWALALEERYESPWRLTSLFSSVPWCVWLFGLEIVWQSELVELSLSR